MVLFNSRCIDGSSKETILSLLQEKDRHIRQLKTKLGLEKEKQRILRGKLEKRSSRCNELLTLVKQLHGTGEVGFTMMALPLHESALEDDKELGLQVNQSFERTSKLTSDNVSKEQCSGEHLHNSTKANFDSAKTTGQDCGHDFNVSELLQGNSLLQDLLKKILSKIRENNVVKDSIFLKAKLEQRVNQKLLNKRIYQLEKQRNECIWILEVTNMVLDGLTMGGKMDSVYSDAMKENRKPKATNLHSIRAGKEELLHVIAFENHKAIVMELKELCSELLRLLVNYSCQDRVPEISRLLELQVNNLLGWEGYIANLGSFTDIRDEGGNSKATQSFIVRSNYELERSVPHSFGAQNRQPSINTIPSQKQELKGLLQYIQGKFDSIENKKLVETTKDGSNPRITNYGYSATNNGKEEGSSTEKLQGVSDNCGESLTVQGPLGIICESGMEKHVYNNDKFGQSRCSLVGQAQSDTNKDLETPLYKSQLEVQRYKSIAKAQRIELIEANSRVSELTRRFHDFLYELHSEQKLVRKKSDTEEIENLKLQLEEVEVKNCHCLKLLIERDKRILECEGTIEDLSQKLLSASDQSSLGDRIHCLSKINSSHAKTSHWKELIAKMTACVPLSDVEEPHEFDTGPTKVEKGNRSSEQSSAHSQCDGANEYSFQNSTTKQLIPVETTKESLGEDKKNPCSNGTAGEEVKDANQEYQNNSSMQGLISFDKKLIPFKLLVNDVHAGVEEMAQNCEGDLGESELQDKEDSPTWQQRDSCKKDVKNTGEQSNGMLNYIATGEGPIETNMNPFPEKARFPSLTILSIPEQENMAYKRNISGTIEENHRTTPNHCKVLPDKDRHLDHQPTNEGNLEINLDCPCLELKTKLKDALANQEIMSKERASLYQCLKEVQQALIEKREEVQHLSLSLRGSDDEILSLREKVDVLSNLTQETWKILTERKRLSGIEGTDIKYLLYQRRTDTDKGKTLLQLQGTFANDIKYLRGDLSAMKGLVGSLHTTFSEKLCKILTMLKSSPMTEIAAEVSDNLVPVVSNQKTSDDEQMIVVHQKLNDIDALCEAKEAELSEKDNEIQRLRKKLAQTGRFPTYAEGVENGEKEVKLLLQHIQSSMNNLKNELFVLRAEQMNMAHELTLSADRLEKLQVNGEEYEKVIHEIRHRGKEKLTTDVDLQAMSDPVERGLEDLNTVIEELIPPPSSGLKEVEELHDGRKSPGENCRLEQVSAEHPSSNQQGEGLQCTQNEVFDMSTEDLVIQSLIPLEVQKLQVVYHPQLSTEQRREIYKEKELLESKTWSYTELERLSKEREKLQEIVAPGKLVKLPVYCSTSNTNGSIRGKSTLSGKKGDLAVKYEVNDAQTTSPVLWQSSLGGIGGEHENVNEEIQAALKEKRFLTSLCQELSLLLDKAESEIVALRNELVKDRKTLNKSHRDYLLAQTELDWLKEAVKRAGLSTTNSDECYA